jgi:hypothetical protein
VDFYDNGVFLTYILLPLWKTGSMFSGSFSLSASAFWASGIRNQITAVYDGDGNYAPSTSNVATISVTQRVGDFALAPQLSQITFAPGSSGTVGLNLAALNNFSGAVSLSCATSSTEMNHRAVQLRSRSQRTALPQGVRVSACLGFCPAPLFSRNYIRRQELAKRI